MLLSCTVVYECLACIFLAATQSKSRDKSKGKTRGRYQKDVGNHGLATPGRKDDDFCTVPFSTNQVLDKSEPPPYNKTSLSQAKLA